MKMANNCIETGDSLNLAHAYYSLTSSYLNKQEYEKALQYAQEAYRIVTSYPDVSLQYLINATTLMSSAWGYFDIDNALKYADEALTLIEKDNASPFQKAYALYEITYLHIRNEDYAAAERTAIQALEADTTDTSLAKDLYRYVTWANIMLGKKEQAIEYFEYYAGMVEELSRQEFQASISEMEVKYETEKKEMRIASLEEEKQLMIRSGILIGMVLLIAFFFFWRWTVQKKRTAEQQIKQLQQEKQLVATQALFDGEVKERARLARDLHDGLGGILAAAKYNLSDVKHTPEQEIIDAEHLNKGVNLLDESMRELRRIAHHLMPETLSIAGLKHAISDFCNTIPQTKFNWYGEEARFDPKLEVMIYQIIHELVSNAIKHSKAEHILVQIVRESNRISLTVQDDGYGFDVRTASKGMGLTNIRNRVAACNGNLLIDSKPGTGTEVSVEINN
jgi:signal transduction histidine kinase